MKEEMKEEEEEAAAVDNNNNNKPQQTTKQAATSGRGLPAWGLPQGRNKNIHLEDLGRARIIILKWLLKEEDEWAWTGLIWIRIKIRDGLFGTW
jgi:hypothetical protein